MKVEKQILCTLLDSSTSYLIPLFQRGYVWTEINWETLWDDLVRNDDDRRGGRDVQHFIGALVLQQMETMAGHMPQMKDLLDIYSTGAIFQGRFD